MNNNHAFSLFSALVFVPTMGVVFSMVPAQAYQEQVVVAFTEPQLPSEELVFKALHTLGLNSYKQVRERYALRLTEVKTEEQKKEIENAFKILTNPLVESHYILEEFIDTFQLKTKDPKIESFDITYGRFKMHTKAFFDSFNAAYFLTDPQRAVLSGKKIYGKRLTDAFLKFNRTQTAYYMEPKKTRQVLERCRADLVALDPSRSFFLEEYKLIDAEEYNLKNFEKMPGVAQSAARAYMKKNIK